MRRAAALPASPIGRRPLPATALGTDRFARNGDLALADPELGVVRQVDVDPRAEADYADTLPGGDRVALAHERHDPPRDQSRDLHHADAPPGRVVDQCVALDVLASLVELGFEEFSRPIVHA